MKQIRHITFILSFILVMLNMAFTSDKPGTEYGLISVSSINNGEYNKYVVGDLKILDSLNAIYSCDLGGSFCQVNLKIDIKRAKRSGLYNEIVEIDINPAKAEYSGEGFHFSFEYGQ